MDCEDEAVVFVAAARTPVGSFNGALSTLHAHELASVVIKELLQRTKIDPKELSEVILGQVLPAGAGQNPARQASLESSKKQYGSFFFLTLFHFHTYRVILLLEWQMNRTVIQGEWALQRLFPFSCKKSCFQYSKWVRMLFFPQAPHVIHLRGGVKMGEASLQDSIIVDGLTDVFYCYHMGITAENVAKRWKVSREEQDHQAVMSQNKAENAQKGGYFNKEIVPVAVPSRKGQ
ncbi:acetyl-CoA acetyltransferase, cytosolic-like [Protobothrops mucrosquamatus]|uniref:acetyl-CoA acetyltransferase, cytosolic-like n=1 Tax=Protobothrops mucrosquamatus TaxID=103944 RepID=UPI000775AA00|nr:acetyl-CoA acetyltransferase, cytosolic-like [Protobothrops mucrosquamatus]